MERQKNVDDVWDANREDMMQAIIVHATPAVTPRYVHVPLFLPTECSNCRAEGSLKCQAGSKSIAVITRDGRFDLSNTSFCCSKCLCIAEASVEVYLQSGFWPGCPTSLTYLFSTDVLEHWTHLKHQLPGSSERKYLTILEELSKTRGRFDVISRVHFARASREYEYMQHQINTKILSRQVMVCKACGVKPKALHVDGNFKLYRWRLSHIKEKAKILVEIPHIPLAVYYTSESHIIRNADTSEFPDQCTTITDAVSTDSPTNFAHPIGKTRRTKAHLKGVPEKRARSEGKQHASSRVKNSVIDLDYHKSITGDVLTRSLITDCAAGQLKIGSRNSCENFSSATPSRTPPFPPTPTPSPTPSFPPTPSPSPIHPVPLPLQISNAIKVNNKDLVKTPEEMFFRGPQGKLLKVVRCTQTYFNSKLNFEPGKYHPFSYILSFLKERILNQESAILVHIVKSDSSLSPMPLSVSP
ncbi:uncharacterized protein LOC123468527 isoform X3 [Daphnia magna]|uniref:uncharacterized protein LOC123468527 isoform X3 n=2 Tax=Daphnia magna TaxID=35525 RepID=UPI001E1BDB6C|nr:uncharacterized protein LOC123468527 isoform X3 [Daphnia magna]